MAFVIAWEFVIKPGAEERFEHVYGPEGDWAQLFRRAAGYVRTELLRDIANVRRYLCLDYWDSEDAFERFQLQWGREYKALDAECEALTEAETPLGSFEAV
jgi:heme-degrading monooxygenase HmoA